MKLITDQAREAAERLRESDVETAQLLERLAGELTVADYNVWAAERREAEVRALAQTDPGRFARRLSIALGLLAPGGTAPAQALHELYVACEAGTDPRRPIGQLQRMLEPNYANWDAIENPTPLPDPDSDEYASGLSVLEGLRRFKKLAAPTETAGSST